MSDETQQNARLELMPNGGVKVRGVVFLPEFFEGLLDGSLRGHIFQMSPREKDGEIYMRDLTVEMLDSNCFTRPQ